MFVSYLSNLWQLSLEAAPWLLLGLVIAALLKVLIPQKWLEQHLGGEGMRPMVKAALLGAPLPLCSCGVIPAALALRRNGASKPSTVSFLVSTPETGVDSVSITYALMGPVMAIARPVAAIASALVAGLLVMRSDQRERPASAAAVAEDSRPACGAATPVESCCAPKPPTTESCCGSTPSPAQTSLTTQLADALAYTFRQLYNDILIWLVAGLLFAAAIQTFVPATFLSQWGSGLPAMLVMILMGVPMYVCATASTPIAAGLMLAGISPGTALVFLMAGPATNIGSLGIISKELGNRAVVGYLAGVCVTAIVAGLVLDAAVTHYGLNIQTQLSHAHEMLPLWLAVMSLLILVAAAAAPRMGLIRK